MPTTFEEAFERIRQLCADFRANEKFYCSPTYQEQEARRDFIDKFWVAFGWDVNHDTQKNPFEQEVKVERMSTAPPSAAPTMRSPWVRIFST